MRRFIRVTNHFMSGLYTIDAGGNNVQLLPNPYRSDNYFNGGTVYEIPTGGDRFNLDVLQGRLSNIDEDDAVFIFFAGHGATTHKEKLTGGDLGYLIPFDGTSERDKMYQYVWNEMISCNGYLRPAMPLIIGKL